MIVRITLASNIGADLGPFNLTANAGSVVPNTATRAQLLGGLNVTASNSATTLTATSTGACTNGVTMTITSIPVYASNITASLESDVTSIGDLRITYTRVTDNELRTVLISDLLDTDLLNQTDFITNAKAGTITVSVNKYTSGTTLEVGTGTTPPSVFLSIEVNGSGIFNQLVNTGNLTVNHSFTQNEGDEIEIRGIISTN
jgi:hypothetical protein